MFIRIIKGTVFRTKAAEPGDVFDTTMREAGYLLATGKAIVIEDPQPPAPAEVEKPQQKRNRKLKIKDLEKR